MDISVNGDKVNLPDGPQSLVQLLVLLGLQADQPGIAIALNMEVVPRSQWPHTIISEGDQVELITARQGG